MHTLNRHPSRILSRLRLGFCMGVVLVGAVGADPGGSFGSTAVDDTGLVVEASDVAAWSELFSAPGPVTLPGFPLSASQTVNLELTRFAVTSPRTRFVVGHEQRPLDFDPSSVVLLRGTVRGHPESRVFLALSDYGSLGYVDFGRSGERFEVSSAAPADAGAPVGFRIRRVSAARGGALPVPLCGIEPSGAQPAHHAPGGHLGATGVKHIELAIETDYEMFQLFGDLSAAGAYVVSLYGVVSDIFERDVNAWVELTFVRLWDTPNDLFNEDSPLTPFRDYWEANMGGVQRDLAQFFSGRRDLPWGGIAWLGTLCTEFGYSVTGYAHGFYVDPAGPAIGNRDITVTAHELGHNCDAAHTHDYGLDTCDDENSAPQRGTIMSYCGQTFTGGEANLDPRFHTIVQVVMQDFFAVSDCIDDDCNQNATADAQDIAMGTSLDANGNGVPDECEDCNTNGTLDPQDISSGTSADLNGNGVPDECEADCNGNGVPDDRDIGLGVSQDANANLVPDECEPDCDSDGTLDFVEINADMSLDLNRNVVLDACEDCDGDGTTDLVELDHANNVWIASLDHTTLREYLAHVGPLTDISDEAGLSEGQDLIITADRRVLVSSGLDDRVVEFEVDGTLVGNLVAPGAGGLDHPAGLLIGRTGNLLVASRGTDEVLEFDATTGSFVGALVSAGAGGLFEPFGLAFDSAGVLYVTSNDGRILRYDGNTGSVLGEFVSVADNGGLDDPHGLLFLPNGNLLAASYETDQILEYEAGSGAFVRQFNQGGTIDRLTLDQPWTLRLGPDGNVYVSRAHDHAAHARSGGGGGDALHLTNARIYEFDLELGFLERAYILGVDSGIEHPTGFDFVPGTGLDCNRNLLPDVCDIALGTSQDANGNGVPDECDVNVYCNAKRSSLGCVPRIASAGLPTLTGADDFRITASDVVGATTGCLLLGLAPNPPGGGGRVQPFGSSPLGGRYCVYLPSLAGTQPSGGTPGACDGSFGFALTQGFFGSQGLAAGTPVYTQIWYRDPGHPDGTGVGHTAGLSFVVLP